MFKLLKGSRMAALLATVLLASGATMAQTTAGGQAAGSAASAATVPAASSPSAADLDTVRKMFGERFPGVKIDGVKHTPFPDLFEVQIGMDLLYTDGRVNYIMQGALIDAQTRRDLTAEGIERLS